MATADLLRLIALGAIWGASFLFMRIIAPVLGAAWSAELRVLIAGLALWLYARARGEDVQLARRWKPYAAIGATNCALPFLMFAFAAMTLPASTLAVINATSPLFGALFATLFLGERLRPRQWVGCVVGFAGVGLLVGDVEVTNPSMFGWAVAAGLIGAASYGIATIVARKWASDSAPLAAATGTQLASAALIAPLLPLMPPLAAPSIGVIGAVFAIALASSGLGYLIYFRLLQNVGAVKTLTVTFLTPLFGIVWGAIFLAERISFAMLGGATLILAAIWMVNRR